MRTLHAALLTPLTGPLALYGKASAVAPTLWAGHAAHLPASFTSVDLEVHDTAENLPQALQRVLEKPPDVMFGPYGSYPMLVVARSCPRLLWNHSGASSRLARPAFLQVINVLSPASTYFAGFLQAIHATDPTARTVSLVHSTTGFGREVAAGAKQEAARLQMPTGCATSFPSTAIRFESILHRFSFLRKRRCLNPCPWTSVSVERAC